MLMSRGGTNALKCKTILIWGSEVHKSDVNDWKCKKHRQLVTEGEIIYNASSKTKYLSMLWKLFSHSLISKVGAEIWWLLVIYWWLLLPKLSFTLTFITSKGIHSSIALHGTQHPSIYYQPLTLILLKTLREVKIRMVGQKNFQQLVSG